MNKKLWWHGPLRVIQTNLQVKDTIKMDPKKIAEEIHEMAANVLVMNVGGIYAWYQSKVKYHHINEFLPKDIDLLKEIISECHNKSIKVIARFDFSKTDDYVFQEKPQWFVRDSEKKPRIYGRDRMGDWSLLLSTCINAGYRNEELAVPVVNEVLEMYEIDGIFLNAPHYEVCHCDTCKSKYFKKYGKKLPEDHREFEKDWASSCLKDNVEKIYKAVKAKNADIPVILYYNLYRDNLNDRIVTADMICTEPQDILSLGYKEIPQFWKPALSIKMGRTLDNYPKPFGIIHSCPGMDWRHTGLPPAEHMFWMSQVPANGGYIWHSLTGFNDTISDKRILKSVSELNHMIQKTESHMENAKGAAQTLLLWNAQSSAEGWAEGLINTQTLFDVMDYYQITLEGLKRFKVVIIPENYNFTLEITEIIKEYVKTGGNIIVEGTARDKLYPVLDVIGVREDIVSSEFLTASYLKFEAGAGLLQKSFENTPMIAHRGVVAYCKPEKSTQLLATLVPPFAPMDAVGAPPERASILTPQTNIPLAAVHEYGKGKAIFLPFQLSMLAKEFKLKEHYQLMKNCADMLLGEDKIFNMESVNGIQSVMYEKENKFILHLVNGIGQRPLTSNVPYHGLNFSIKLKGNVQVKSVYSCIGGEKLEYTVQGNVLNCTLDVLKIWDMIVIETQG